MRVECRDGSASMGGVAEIWAARVSGQVTVLDGSQVPLEAHLAGWSSYERSSTDWSQCDQRCAEGLGPRPPRIVAESATAPIRVDVTTCCEPPARK